MTELPPDVLRTLYTADPDDFMSVRKSLGAQAKQSGDAALAWAITAERKPTIGAWVVNRHVHADPSAVEQLLELGARLRTAHEQLDAQVLRELSTERRQVVTELGTAALTAAERADAGATLRDDVTDTFDAAVADPQIAARLGRLTRGEKWSGFGVATDAPAGAPELTVIRGGRDRATAKPTKPTTKRTAPETAEPAADNAKDRARTRALEKAAKAREALTTADTALRDSEAAETDAAQHVRELTAELTRIQRSLADAKRAHDRSRQQLRSARNRRREARTTLTRAERQAEPAPQ